MNNSRICLQGPHWPHSIRFFEILVQKPEKNYLERKTSPIEILVIRIQPRCESEGGFLRYTWAYSENEGTKSSPATEAVATVPVNLLCEIRHCKARSTNGQPSHQSCSTAKGDRPLSMWQRMAQTVQPVRSLGTNHVEMHLAAKAGKDRKEVPRNNHDSPFDNSLKCGRQILGWLRSIS